MNKLITAEKFAKNTGFYTFYQNNIPVDMMGKVGSMYDLLISILTILTTIVFGFATHFISIQVVIIVGAFVMLLITIVLCAFNLLPSKTKLYSGRSLDAKEI